MLWSILIAGIPERYHSVQPLLHSLLEQQHVARISDTELLYFMDNRRRSVGSKRNTLLASASGEYISFIDDDDAVAVDYVDKLRRAISETRRSETPADVICFGQRATLKPHGVIHECTYSIKHWKEREPGKRRALEEARDDKGAAIPNVLKWTGPPAHTMVWKRALLEGIRFQDRMFGEDTEFVDKACEKAVTELQIPSTLYFYNFDEAGSATR